MRCGLSSHASAFTFSLASNSSPSIADLLMQPGQQLAGLPVDVRTELVLAALHQLARQVARHEQLGLAVCVHELRRPPA